MFGIIRNRRGFTLVELIVVIIIVGVLAAVAAPTMMDNVKKAKRTEAIAVMGALRSAERLCKTEFGAYEDVVAGAVNTTNLNKYLDVNELTGRNYNVGNYSVTSATNTIAATGAAANGGPCNMNLITGALNE